jgi:SAM-dependent methyltransferase
VKRSSEVKEFYDKFSKRVLVRDFYYLNRRHEAIKSLCNRFVPKGSAILEIGCGVGIISKFLNRAASRLVAIDISEKNVEIARQFAASQRSQFEVVDVLEQASKLDKYGNFDVVLMADVIEHIPKSEYLALFATIEGVLSQSGRVILTYPTPEYQEHMTLNKPDDMQVIDESIEIDHIVGATSLKLVYFCYVDVSGRNDYVHVVLAVDRPYTESLEQDLFGWLVHRIKKYRWRLGNLTFLRRLRRRNLTD